MTWVHLGVHSPLHALVIVPGHKVEILGKVEVINAIVLEAHEVMRNKMIGAFLA